MSLISLCMCLRGGKKSYVTSHVWVRAPVTAIPSVLSSDCCRLRLQLSSPPVMSRSLPPVPYWADSLQCLIWMTTTSSWVPVVFPCHYEGVWMCVSVCVSVACAIMYGCCAVPVWLLWWCWCFFIFQSSKKSWSWSLYLLYFCNRDVCHDFKQFQQKLDHSCSFVGCLRGTCVEG